MYILTTEGDVGRRWGEALAGRPTVVADIEALQAQVDAAPKGEPVLVFLHLGHPALQDPEVPAQLLNRYPDARFVALSDYPNEAEGMNWLMAGAMGYLNTYAAPGVIQRVVETIREGEVWVGQRLMARLVEAVTPSQGEGREAESLSDLTGREREVARLVGQGMVNKQIARQLDISERTVKAHVNSIFRKTGTGNRLELALLTRQGA